MALSQQTQADLASILDTLDQRIHELTASATIGADQVPASADEVPTLQALRTSAAAMLGVN